MIHGARPDGLSARLRCACVGSASSARTRPTGALRLYSNLLLLSVDSAQNTLSTL